MSLRLVAVRFQTSDPPVLGEFWAALLTREVVDDLNGVLLPGDDTQVGLRFVASTSPKPEWNRLHLHLTSASTEDQRRLVDAVIKLGGERFGTKPLPFGRSHITLSDPGGNEFCVIEPGNGFLAGCGFLGEFTCDGTREVGMFWSDVLGWPLVWDQGEQTAIQSPRGGTKISWDAWPVSPKDGRHRQQFDLAGSEPALESERLVALGATVLGDRDDGIALADPDGNRFLVSPDQ